MKPKNYQFYNGFKGLDQECSNFSINLASAILPEWLKGTLLKVGPAYFKTGKQLLNHWFDGLAMLYKFDISNKEIKFSNSFIKSEQYKGHQKGQMLYDEFATKANVSFIKKILNTFATIRGKNVLNPSCNVNIAKINNNFMAMTEVNNNIGFTPESLITKGLIEYQDKLRGHISTAHPYFDTQKNELINLLVQIGTQVEYQIYSIDSSQGLCRTPIVKFSKPYLFYTHSFFVTENYIILYNGPLQTTPSQLLIKTFNEALYYNKEHKCELIVINRNDHKITTIPVEPFLFLHSINSYESDKGQIILDLIAYPEKVNPYNMFYFNKLASNNIDVKTELRRYSIGLKSKQVSYKKMNEETIEFPYINSKFQAKQYRYLYAAYIDKIRPYDFLNGIIKIDLNNDNDKTTQHKWHKPELYPSEPIFVKNPTGIDEDDGVLITNVYDSSRHISQLLILDAKTFDELLLADLPYHIPFTLHGGFYQI